MCKSPSHECTKFWREPHFDNLDLLHATYITHRFAPHIHEGFAIGVITSGVETFRYRRTHYTAIQGDVVLINPDEVHTGEAGNQQGWTYRMFYPSTHLLQQAASQIADRPQTIPFFNDPIIHDAELAQLLINLHAVLEEPYPDTLMRESYLLWTLAELVTRYADNTILIPKAGVEKTAVYQAKQYLNRHYHQNITLANLADYVHLSPYHLLRVFRAHVGLPPHAYLTQIRVQHAKRLLRAHTPIAHVATATGFSDQSHLTKRFKRIVGVTPGKYRGRM